MKKLLVAVAVSGLIGGLFAAPAFATRSHDCFDCQQETTLTFKGEVPCYCYVKLPQAKAIKLFGPGAVSKQNGVASLGKAKAWCNTGFIQVRIKSANDGLEHNSGAKIKYNLVVAGALENKFGEGTDTYDWKSTDYPVIVGALNPNGGGASLAVQDVESMIGKPSGDYIDYVTITVSGEEL